MQVAQWGIMPNISVFGRKGYSRTAISKRVERLCQEIREEMDDAYFPLSIVADTLEAIGIFSADEIKAITQLERECALKGNQVQK